MGGNKMKIKVLCHSYLEFNNCESYNYMSNKGCIKCKEGYYINTDGNTLPLLSAWRFV